MNIPINNTMRPCRCFPHPYCTLTFAILLVLLVSILPALADGATTKGVISPIVTNLSEKSSQQSAAAAPHTDHNLQERHSAANVEGRIWGAEGSIPPHVRDAAAKQESIKYTSTIYDKPPRDVIKKILPDVGIFFFHGHGKPGRIQTNEREDEYYYARGDPEGYNIDSMSSLSNLKLALLLGCETGKTDHEYGNFVDSMYAKDGECVIGFAKEIFDPGTMYYSQKFWDEIASGAFPMVAQERAVAFVKSQSSDKCAGEEKCDGTCCLDREYHSNGCIDQLKNQPEIIDFEPGRSIAEAYARVNNPDLFQESSTKELRFHSEIIDHGNWGRVFKYVWDEYLYYPDKFTEPHVVIAGHNETYITVSPYTGEISFYFSSSVPPDPTMSLNPTLTEEQALEIAKVFAAKQFYFTERGITPDPSEWKSEGLRVFQEHDKAQHLAWVFDVRHRLAPDSYSIGGGVFVDAHDGTILGFNEIA